jgi:hypothetical protein
MPFSSVFEKPGSLVVSQTFLGFSWWHPHLTTKNLGINRKWFQAFVWCPKGICFDHLRCILAYSIRCQSQNHSWFLKPDFILTYPIHPYPLNLSKAGSMICNGFCTQTHGLLPKSPGLVLVMTAPGIPMLLQGQEVRWSWWDERETYRNRQFWVWRL